MGSLREKVEQFLRRENVRKITRHLPEVNLITIHYLYFIVTCMLSSLIFWGSSDPSYSISYTNSLFLVVSAMTEAGLNTVNLSTLTTFQQFILWALILLGSSIWVSIFTIIARKRIFERRFKDIVKQQKEMMRDRGSRRVSEVRDGSLAKKRLDEARKAAEPVDKSDFEGRHSEPRDPTSVPASSGLVAEKPSDPLPAVRENDIHGDSSLTNRVAPKEAVEEKLRNADIMFLPYAPSAPATEPQGHTRLLSFVGVGAHPNSTSFRSPAAQGIASRISSRPETREQETVENPLPHWQYPHYLTRQTTGHNAQFYGLSRAEREHLGGVEYRAIQLLSFVVPIYFVLWQLLGCLGLAAYIAHNKASTARENGINPWWLGIFNGVSAFNNSGMSLLDANMVSCSSSIQDRR